jgi:hypothetical protein
MAATAALSDAAVADLVTDTDDIAAFNAAIALVTGVIALGAGCSGSASARTSSRSRC